MYETFEHTADLGLRVRAADLPNLFVDAARGLFSIIVANLDAVRPLETVSINVEGETSELLLFDWLGELLYTYDTRRLLLSEFDVQLGPTGLTATARGEPIDPGRHTLDHEVKAITYHGLKLQRENDGWLAEVIVDI
ncbi:MAG: archease [Planctomycetia bacterium]|nr:archease [Planctomycetia bacterium]